MPRHYRPGERIYLYSGKQVKNKKGEIVAPTLFGHGPGQIKVSALGRAKDRIRLTDVDTGEKHDISRYEYERLKEEVKAGHFKHKEAFFKATYWQTREGQNARSYHASENFETMLDARYDNVPGYGDYKAYILELFNGLSNKEKADFFEKEDKLIREVWEYDYKLNLEEYKEYAPTSEFDLLIKKLEEYYRGDSDRLIWTKRRAVNKQLFEYDYEQYS